MNNQIEQLAEQSGYQEGFRFSMEDFDRYKFAELIVKEILNISDEVITLSDSPEWLICERLGINHDWRRQDNFWS